jgi:hypothetical protein
VLFSQAHLVTLIGAVEIALPSSATYSFVPVISKPEIQDSAVTGLCSTFEVAE